MELFDSAKVPFYDGLYLLVMLLPACRYIDTDILVGCMLVELLDYRPQRNKEPTPEKPERTRVILHPDSETLWADICLLNQKTGSKWTDADTLEVEARILVCYK